MATRTPLPAHPGPASLQCPGGLCQLNFGPRAQTEHSFTSSHSPSRRHAPPLRHQLQSASPRLSNHRVSSKVSTTSTLCEWTSAPPAANTTALRTGLLATKARKCRLLPIEYALWKNRGLGKGRLQLVESPACEYSCCTLVSCGCGGGNSAFPSSFVFGRQLDRVSHQSQGCSEAWVGGISSVTTWDTTRVRF